MNSRNLVSQNRSGIRNNGDNDENIKE